MRPSHFSLLVQRKSNQKEGARLRAFRTSCAPGPRVVTEFFEGASMHLRKTACIVHAALRVDRHRPPLRRGPFTGSASMRSRAELRCALLVIVLVLVMLFLRAGARALQGAPAKRRWVADQPAGWPTGCRPSFRRHTDVPSKRPAMPRGPVGQDVRRALRRAPLFWLPFLDSGHPALSPSGRLRRSRRSCGAVDNAKKSDPTASAG
jgi:hypothetical protein